MGTTPEERLGVMEKSVMILEKDNSKQWTQIDDLRKYMQKLVPVWTAMVLMAMSAVTASALTFAGMMIKITGSE